MNIQIEGIIQYLSMKPSRMNRAFSGGFKSKVCEDKWISSEIQLSEGQYRALNELNQSRIYRLIWQGATMDVWCGKNHILRTIDT